MSFAAIDAFGGLVIHSAIFVFVNTGAVSTRYVRLTFHTNMSKFLTFEAAYTLNSCLNEFLRSVVDVVNQNAFIQCFLMLLDRFEYYFDRTQRSSVFFPKSRSG